MGPPHGGSEAEPTEVFLTPSSVPESIQRPIGTMSEHAHKGAACRVDAVRFSSSHVGGMPMKCAIRACMSGRV